MMMESSSGCTLRRSIYVVFATVRAITGVAWRRSAARWSPANEIPCDSMVLPGAEPAPMSESNATLVPTPVAVMMRSARVANS